MTLLSMSWTVGTFSSRPGAEAEGFGKRETANGQRDDGEKSEVVVAVPAFGLAACSGSWHLPLVVVAKRSSGQLPATASAAAALAAATVAAAAPQTVEQHH